MQPVRFALMVLLFLSSTVFAADKEHAAQLPMSERVKACTQCHGDQGRASPEGFYPRIAGKPEVYLFNQLLNFREGRRQHATMNYLVENLSDAYLLQMAQYFSALNPPYASAQRSQVSPQVFELGRQLVHEGSADKRLPACADCHGKNLMGIAPTMPGLLGLSKDYLNSQLGAWSNGQRKAAQPDCMADMVKQMGAQEMDAVSAYLSSLPVPRQVKTPPASTSEAFPKSCGTHRITSVEAALVASPNPTPPLAADAVKRGAYLATLANCAGCHSQPGQAAYSGGRAIETPYGRVYASNLTPDVNTGLGAWTAEEFHRAMTKGISRDGHSLYPAFPFVYYARLSRPDTDAIFDYLRQIPAAQRKTPAADMRFPYNIRPLMVFWRMLYGAPAPQPVPTGLADGQWQRGEWLVNGVGHCGACHTPKGSLGGDRSGHHLSGAQMPVVDWYAPPLRGLAGSLSQARFLSAGQSADRAVAGPMAHVVAGSLQHWTTADVNAAVTYLTSLPKPAARVAIGNTISISALEFERSMTAGAKLYERHCKDCHGTGGEGRSQVYPALAGNVAVQEQPPTNAIRLTLNGGYPPSTAGNPMPTGMPPYRTVMSAQEIADTLTFIRKSWGAQGSVVTAVDVEKYRGAWIGNHHQ